MTYRREPADLISAATTFAATASDRAPALFRKLGTYADRAGFMFQPWEMDVMRRDAAEAQMAVANGERLVIEIAEAVKHMVDEGRRTGAMTYDTGPLERASATVAAALHSWRAADTGTRQALGNAEAVSVNVC